MRENEFPTSKDIVNIQSSLLDELDDSVLAHTLDGRVIYANPAFCGQTGVSPDDLDDLPPYGWLSKAQEKRQALITETLARDGHTEFVAILEGPDGHRFASVRSRVIVLGEEPIVLSMSRDETERYLDRRDLEFRSMLLDSANDAIFVHTLDGRMLYVNEAAAYQRGYTRDELFDLPLALHVPEDRRDTMHERLACIRRDGTAVFETTNLRKDGTLMPVEVRSRLVEFDGEDVVMSVISDITERKRTEENIQRLAFYDALTDLPNRRLFMDRLERALAHLPRTHETLAVLFIDVDDLKTVNDSLGHHAGDALLLEVAKRLSELVRFDDTVARLAGDEFVALLLGTDEDGARETAERMLDALREPFEVDGQRMFVTASMGVAIADERETDPETVLRNADLAMYEVKSGPRDGYMVFEPKMSEAALERFNLTNDLRTAIRNDELSLYYQPQVRLADGAIVGVEALLRWNSPTRGFVPPLDFIAVAEETGIIIPLGEWVLRQACADQQRWREQGHQLRVAVNISARQVMQGDLIGLVRQLLEEHGIGKGMLELEVTESVALSRSSQVRQTLRDLSALGVRIAIDDFGTGYSSLSQLQSLPINTLKVDRSFVMSIRDDASEQIARAVLALGRGLNLNVVAEGVETREQLEFLAEHDCAEFQGYLFSPAVPTDEITRLLESSQE